VLRILEVTGLAGKDFIFENSGSAVSAAAELSSGPSS
jgi:hypothetical protein